MTMADRSISTPQVSTQEPTDQQAVSSQRMSPPATPTQPSYRHSSNDTDNLDLRPLTSERLSGLPTRDSGYGTDLSPATTSSPAATTPRQHHFTYSGIGQCAVPDINTTPSSEDANAPSPHQEATQSTTICHVDPERPARSIQSPSQLDKPPTYKRTTVYTISHAPSSPLSESSDTNRVQFDFESDDEGIKAETHRRDANRSSQFTSTPNSTRHFDLSGNQVGFHLYDDKLDEDDDDDTFYPSKNDTWDLSSEYYTARRRRKIRSQSLRLRRSLSRDNYDETTYDGACGGSDPSAPYFDNDHLQDQDPGILLEPGLLSRDREPTRSGFVEGCNPHNTDNTPFIDAEASLTGSQGFKPGYFDTDRRDSDSATVVTTCPRSEEDEDSYPSPGASRAVPIVRDRTAQRSTSVRRRHGVTINELSALEYLPPWGTTFSAVSVSTQTPHVTSVMIQQILHSPVPNQTRGTVATRFHRLSVGGMPLPPGPTQLPDIITSVGRDRSHSVPNLQTLESRNIAREVGLELRRLSDEFNIRRILTPVNEEFDGHPASYPRMHLRNTINQFGALLRDTFRGRHNSFN